jgi:hypothetical protein
LYFFTCGVILKSNQYPWHHPMLETVISTYSMICALFRGIFHMLTTYRSSCVHTLKFFIFPYAYMQKQVKLPETEAVAPQVKPEISIRSAPIFCDNFFDQTVRLRQMRPSSAKHSYKLPTPVDDNYPRSAVIHRSHHSAQFFESKPSAAENLWHSSPLAKDYKVSTMHSGPIKLPSNSDFSKKLKRESWSGPIPSKARSSKPFSQPDHKSSMGHPHVMTSKSYIHARQPSSVSPKTSPLSTVSPQISELHELPRPPANVEPLRPSGLVGYSGPLVSKRQAPMPPARASLTASHTASPLPRPPSSLARSYSIPSNSQRTPLITVNSVLLLQLMSQMI